MITLLLHLLPLLPFLFAGGRHPALRQQLAVYKGTVIRPPLRSTDRLFWVGKLGLNVAERIVSRLGTLLPGRPR